MTLADKDPKGSVIFPTTGTANSLAPLVDFSKRGDKNNFGPRIGFAWDVRQDSKTVVRADYGIYYNPMNLQVTSAEQANYRQPTATIPTPTYPDPYGGRDPLSFVSTAPANIQVMANNLENLQSAAYTAGISQGLTSAMALHVDAVYDKMTKVPMAVDINPRSAGTTGTRPLPQFARVLQTQPIGYLNYKALLVRLEKRLDHNYLYTISYTLASTKGIVNNIGPSSTITDSGHILYDLGPNNSDRRNTLVASGSFLVPGAITVGTVFTYRSSQPFSAVAGADLNGDAAITDYVPGTTRNVFNRGNDTAMLAAVNAYRATLGLVAIPESRLNTNEFYSLDVRGSKSIPLSAGRKVELIAQVFNVMNRKNLLAAWQTNATSPAFGSIPSAGNMRQAELALRFGF
jgi:hypothetical protein